MMDPSVVATTIVSLLAPYLARAGEAITQHVGDVAWEKAQTIFQKIKEKFAGDIADKAILEKFEEQPENQARQVALVGVLQEALEKDQTLTAQLVELLRDIDKVETSIQQTQTLSDHARVENMLQIGQLDGDIDLRKTIKNLKKKK